MKNDEQFWSFVGSAFNDPAAMANPLVLEAYRSRCSHIPGPDLKKIIVMIRQKQTKLPTPDEIIAAYEGRSKNDRERATMDAMGIWRAIEGIGANGRIDAKMRLNKAQWEAVEKMGTWKSLCDRLTNADKPNFIAQARDMIMDIYARIENEEKRQQLQLEQKKNNQNLIGE